MKETHNRSNQLTLTGIFRLLLRKLKWLILVAVVGAVLGAGFGVFRTYNKKYYGTTIKFFVNPIKPDSGVTGETENQYSIYGTYGQSVMDTMITLLSSEAFAVELLQTTDANGVHLYLPQAGEDATLNALIAQAETSRAALSQKIAAGAEQAEIDAAAAAASTASQKVYARWQGTSSYVDMLWRIQSGVTFSYITQADSEGSTLAEDLVLPFIYVNISVLNDEAFANYLYDSICLSVPSYVEENMWEPSGYSATSCTPISLYDQVARTNQGVVKSTAVKYAMLLGAAAFAAACVIFVILDIFDSRIRDLDQVSEDLKIPLLGVIPSIVIVGQKTEKNDKKEKTEVKKV